MTVLIRCIANVNSEPADDARGAVTRMRAGDGKRTTYALGTQLNQNESRGLMLGDREALATIAVRDINVAAKFYEGVLGLKPVPTKEKGVQDYKSGSSDVLLYTSQFAGTNRATAVTWMVGADIEKIVQRLKAKGITFEHYDFPGVTMDGDVHVFGKLKNAWFKDPDGNILSIVGGG